MFKRIGRGINYRLKKYFIYPFIRWNLKGGTYLLSKSQITEMKSDKIFQHVITHADFFNIT